MFSLQVADISDKARKQFSAERQKIIAQHGKRNGRKKLHDLVIAC